MYLIKLEILDVLKLSTRIKSNSGLFIYVQGRDAARIPSAGEGLNFCE